VRVVDVGHLADRRGFRQDAEPAERKDAVEGGERAGRERLAGDAVKSVAAGDHLAGERVPGAGVAIANRRRGSHDAVEAEHLGFEQERAAVGEARGDQILHHLLLAVDRDMPAAGQRRQVEMDEPVAEADVERVVDHAFAPEPRVEAERVHHLDGALLEHAGAYAALDVLAGARFQHDAVDAFARQQVRQKQPGRPGADDPDLRAHDDQFSNATIRCGRHAVPAAPAQPRGN
jgi:hypothetical protein